MQPTYQQALFEFGKAQAKLVDDISIRDGAVTEETPTPYWVIIVDCEPGDYVGNRSRTVQYFLHFVYVFKPETGAASTSGTRKRELESDLASKLITGPNITLDGQAVGFLPSINIQSNAATESMIARGLDAFRLTLSVMVNEPVYA